MTQGFINQITDTSTESGEDLAERLNRFDAAVKSGQAGLARPGGIAAGGTWTRENGDGTFTRMLYDGAADVPIAPAPLDDETLASGSTFLPPTVRATKAYADEGGRIRMRISFDGTTNPPTINSSYNVAFITDNGIGDYTINFINAMPNTNYTALLGFSSNMLGPAADPRVVNIIGKTTTSIRLKATIAGNGSVIDLVEISAMIVS